MQPQSTSIDIVEGNSNHTEYVGVLCDGKHCTLSKVEMSSTATDLNGAPSINYSYWYQCGYCGFVPKSINANKASPIYIQIPPTKNPGN